MKRRTFFERCLAGGIALTAFPLFGKGKKFYPQTEFPKRTLGETGEKLSIIGFGGILVSGVEQATANNMVASAFERGINYFDVAPTYAAVTLSTADSRAWVTSCHRVTALYLMIRKFCPLSSLLAAIPAQNSKDFSSKKVPPASGRYC